MSEYSVDAFPGLIEVHTHLRQPSSIESAETIESGSLAHMLGGYVAIGDMPNNLGRKTLTADRYREKVKIAKQKAYTYTFFHAGFDPDESNVGEFGKLMRLTDSAKYYQGDTTGNSKKYGAAEYREATHMARAVNPNALIMLHAHPDTLDETLHMITQEVGLSAHVCHVMVENLPVIKKYRDQGATVTAGVTPHHILMSEFETLRMGWFARMMPPLRSAEDAGRLLHGLKTGEIDCVETDHAPHPPENKMTAEIANPAGLVRDEHGNNCQTCFGVPGGEFAFPIMRNLVRKELIEIDRLVDAFSTAPARIMGYRIHPRTRTFFTDEVYQITEADIRSKSGMSPYVGSVAVGRLADVKISGHSLYKDRTPRPVRPTYGAGLRRGSTI